MRVIKENPNLHLRVEDERGVMTSIVADDTDEMKACWDRPVSLDQRVEHLNDKHIYRYVSLTAGSHLPLRLAHYWLIFIYRYVSFTTGSHLFTVRSHSLLAYIYRYVSLTTGSYLFTITSHSLLAHKLSTSNVVTMTGLLWPWSVLLTPPSKIDRFVPLTGDHVSQFARKAIQCNRVESEASARPTLNLPSCDRNLWVTSCSPQLIIS